MKKNYIVLQEEMSDCGICSLASIIKYYGGNIPLENLRYTTNTDNFGTNAYELIECGKKIGFNAFGEKINDFSNINLPVIAHLKLENNFYHFVVVYRITKTQIYLMDPSIGYKKMNLNEFYKIYTGIILHFIPTIPLPNYRKNNFLKKIIIKEIKKNKKTYLIILLFSLIILILTMVNNIQIKILTNNYKYIYLLFFIVIINEVLIYIKNVMLLKNNLKLNNKVIKKFIAHIFKLPLNYLKLKQKGEISTRFNELNDLTNNIVNYIIDIMFSLILILLLLMYLLFYSFKTFLLILSFTIIYIIFNLKIYKKLINEIKYFINLEETYNSIILDYISNFETIKHLNIYNFFIKNIDMNLSNKNLITKKLNKKIYIFSMINNILINVFIIMILYLILKNNFSLSISLVIYTMLNFYILNIKKIIDYYPTLILFKTYFNKNSEFLSFEENNKYLLNNFSNISIKNVSYSICGTKILNNINFKINNGDKIFINGPSGIGKSTLMKILNNEINKYYGKILIDNKDIKKYDLSELITYVSQNETLFNDSLYNNLTLGKEFREEDLKKIIKITKLDNIESIKNNGLKTCIINNCFLSGGERNRIVLARSLLHSKKIIILDEVLKEVDYILENEIIKNILENYKEKTLLYISHKNLRCLFNKVLTFRKE